MKRALQNEFTLLIGLFFLGLLTRSLHYSEYLNFSTDQALFATKSLELWRSKAITLIGPSISFKFIGRELFQGSLTYYFQLLFLLPARFDPILSSYFFTVFATAMVVPIYFGSKLLVNKKAAWCMAILYIFLPTYIDYTRFLWNPNFQFSLTPLLILCMGLFEKKKNALHIFLLSFSAGALLLFHYQFVPIIFGLTIYYFFVKKISIRSLPVFVAGLMVGFSPLIIFELRNHFYNINTLLLYFSHASEMIADGRSSFGNVHYFLSIGLFIFLTFFWFIRKKMTDIHIKLLFILLFLVSLVRYVPRPTHAFGMVEHWNFLYEQKAYTIVKEQQIENYNIVNLGYDTTATVQKYLMKKDGIVINYDDYYNNNYLFVITKDVDFMSNPAYEVHSFTPSTMIDQWELNDTFTMYLLQRTIDE